MKIALVWLALFGTVAVARCRTRPAGSIAVQALSTDRSRVTGGDLSFS